MELRNLRVLVEVIRQAGFTEAARVLFSTQSTVSKAVRALEDELGLQLVERGARVRATPAGEIAYRHGLRMLGVRQDLTDEIAELKGLRRGTLRIGVPALGGDLLFAPIYAAFRAAWPGIEVQLLEHGSGRLREALRAGEIDVAGLLLPQPDEFVCEEMRREPVVAVLRGDHPLAAQGLIRFGDLAQLPVLLFDPGFLLHRMVVQAFQANHLVPQIAACSGQVGFLVELAAAGAGVTFLPAGIAAAQARAGLVARPLGGPDLEWRMAMGWRREGFLSHAAGAWIDLARDTMRRQQLAVETGT